MNVDISFIIVEYFCIPALKDVVQSIYDYASECSFEIIVISNSSYSQQIQIDIRSSFPGIEFTFNQKNLGFSRGVNQGIRNSSGEFLLLLNPDAKLVDQSLPNAVDFMIAHNQVAVLGPLIVDNSGQLQDSCREFMTFGTMFNRMSKRIFARNLGESVLEDKDYYTAQQVDWVSGACLLARSKAISDAGPMDERYFMYVEDMDWCRNFQQHGWEVWFLPTWKVEHNAGRASSSRLWLMNRLMWTHLLSFCKYNLKWSLSLPRWSI